ncbi:MAG: hypothetical protein HQL90_11120 [Magnetococcales bacterium]|nr:hypothetical protein [Magnetococcales bacterium]
MINFDWQSLLGNTAPGLATALEGPLAGAAAELAVKALGIAPGGHAENLQAIAKAAAQNDPKTALQLKQADQAFHLALEQAVTDRIKLGNQNQANARAREVAVGGRAVPLMGGGILLGSFGLILFILTSDINRDGQAGMLVSSALSFATMGALAVINYYFGSSFGQDKDKKNGP